MKKGFLNFLFLILTCSATALAQLPDNKIEWQEGGMLTWDDFKGKPDPASSFHANTSSGISYGWSFKHSNNKGYDFVFNVYSFFLPDGSWVREGKTSAHLLAHEQLHFDITELHARKLKKALKAVDPKNPGEVKKMIQRIYDKVEREREMMQKQFDFETDHSLNVPAQMKWQEKVRREFESMRNVSGA